MSPKIVKNDIEVAMSSDINLRITYFALKQIGAHFWYVTKCKVSFYSIDTQGETVIESPSLASLLNS